MRLILQRVTSASVHIEGRRVAGIGRGLLVLVGVEKGDGPEAAEWAADKLAHLRIFEDTEGKMNLAAREVGAELLVVSQFTLAASVRKGRRPSFDGAAPAAEAERLIEALVGRLEARELRVATGRFGARMQVELVNDGPVTFVLEL